MTTQAAYEHALEHAGHCDFIELDCGHMAPRPTDDCDECAMEGREA